MLVVIRRGIAGKFGKIEHTAGEILGIVLWGLYIHYDQYRLLVPAIIWIIYFISHRLEKRFYGKYGYR